MNVITPIKQAHDAFADCEQVAYRLAALKKLKAALLAHEDAIYQALQQDLNKSTKESFLCEFNEVLAEIDCHLRHCRR